MQSQMDCAVASRCPAVAAAAAAAAEAQQLEGGQLVVASAHTPQPVSSCWRSSHFVQLRSQPGLHICSWWWHKHTKGD